MSTNYMTAAETVKTVIDAINELGLAERHEVQS